MADVRCAVCAAQLADGAYVCASCAGKLERRLRDAAALWDDLATVVVPRLTRLGDPTPRAGRPAPAQAIRPDSDPADDHRKGWSVDLPFNEAAYETAESARNTLTTWARDIGDTTGEQPPDRMRTLTLWVADRLDKARHWQQADEMFDELWHASGILIARSDRPIPRIDAGLCWAPLPDDQQCEQRLTARLGANHITCPACGAIWKMADRRDTMLGHAQDILGTAVEIAHWLTLLTGKPLPVGTVYSWTSRGRLTAKGHLPTVDPDAKPRPLYRLGDARDLHAEDQQRRAKKAAA